MSKTTIIAFLGGGAIGVFAGFKLAERRLMVEFEEAVEHERTSIAAMYAARQPYASPQEAVDALVDIPEVVEAVEPKEPIAYHRIKPSSVQREEAEEAAKPEPILEDNIFDHNVEPPRIFTIPEIEYLHGDEKYQKVNLTWYVEDKILADFEDEIYTTPETIVGDCLDRFGEQSNDEDVVYVRNTIVDIDYTVSRDPGSYWRSVHGMEPADVPPSGRER